MTETRELADPEFFSRLDGIELRARSVVEGFLHGLHRSPYVGFSVEFASHHEYVPGDDPRHINWKIYARNKKSLCLELRNPAACELVAKLVPSAAILVESFLGFLGLSIDEPSANI